jgi:hypothetical protein
MLAYGAATYAGFIDGLYLYMGLYALTVVVPPAFIVISIFSTLYLFTNVVSRIYEEYDYQVKLKVTEAKTEQALLIKTLKNEIYSVDELLADQNFKALSDSKQHQLIDGAARRLAEATAKFQEQRSNLKSLQKLSNNTALLRGIKTGLVAYGVIASFLFGVGTILLLAGAVFPPALLFAGVILGVACLIGFSVHSVRENKQRLKESVEVDSEESRCVDGVGKLLITLATVKSEESRAVKEAELNQSTLDVVKTLDNYGLVVDSSPQYLFQEWLEIARSCFSGWSKGKSTDFTLAPLQEKDADGHFHDPPVMFAVTVLSTVVNTLVLTFRAIVKGFARLAMDDIVFKDGQKIMVPSCETKNKFSGASTPSHWSLSEESFIALSQQALSPEVVIDSQAPNNISSDLAQNQSKLMAVRSRLYSSKLATAPVSKFSTNTFFSPSNQSLNQHHDTELRANIVPG